MIYIYISHKYSEILFDLLSLKLGRPKIMDKVNREQDKVNGKQRQGKWKRNWGLHNGCFHM